MDPITILLNPEIWKDFGPLALVCSALIYAIYRLIDGHRAERKEILETHRAERKELLETHRAEREEMRREADSRVEQMLAVQRETNLAINGLTHVLSRNGDHAGGGA